jgi:hypothetical protein
MAVLRKTVAATATIAGGVDWFQEEALVNLAPARHRDAKQEGDKQARERRFPGNGADGRERLSGLAGGRDGVAQPVNRGL